MLTAAEVSKGLVVRFDPRALMSNGAAPDRSVREPVRGVHYFVCIARTGFWSVWVPAYSRWLPGRKRIGYKRGAPAWVEPASYVDLEQMWIVPDAALGPASDVAEFTRPGSRNFASWRFLVGDNDEASQALPAPTDLVRPGMDARDPGNLPGGSSTLCRSTGASFPALHDNVRPTIAGAPAVAGQLVPVVAP